MTSLMGRNQSRLCAPLAKQRGNWSYPCCYWRIQRALKFVLCMRKRAMQNVLKNNSFSSKKCISFLSERSGSDTQNRN